MPDFRFAVEICEDLWAPVPPSSAAASAGATVICNLSASNETVGKAEYRRSLVSGQSGRLVAAYLYANCGHGESTTDTVFSGHSLIAENGSVLAERAPFASGGALLITEIDVQRLAFDRRRMNTFGNRTAGEWSEAYFSLDPVETVLTRRIDPHPFVPDDSAERSRRCELILTMQAEGLRRRDWQPVCKPRTRKSWSWASQADWIPAWHCCAWCAPPTGSDAPAGMSSP